jgi:hypothetical protein
MIINATDVYQFIPPHSNDTFISVSNCLNYSNSLMKENRIQLIIIAVLVGFIIIKSYIELRRMKQ